MVIALTGIKDIQEDSLTIQTLFVSQFFSYTVSPVLITINITMYLHFQVPLSLLVALWLLEKDLYNFLYITNLCWTDLAGTISGDIQK